jgi:2-polyprenyl-6-methoxyphenol hydroxylase-like FAD-dependent oxidoreductase
MADKVRTELPPTIAGHPLTKTQNKTTLLIVGVGPVGLLIALRLAQASIPTIVLESHHTLLPTTRAMVCMPVVIPVLRKLGILSTIIDHAFLNHEGAVWRDIHGKELAQLKLQGDEEEKFGGVLLIGQRKRNGLILEELKKYPCVQVRFGQRVVGIEDIPSQEGVKVMAHDALDFNRAGNHDGDVMHESRYAIGTDGANSAVRRMMCIVRLSNVPISTDYEAAIRRLENDRHRSLLRLPQTLRLHPPKFHSRPHRLERHILYRRRRKRLSLRNRTSSMASRLS